MGPGARPPTTSISAELQYVLRHAFGPDIDGAPLSPVNAHAVLHWAEALDVSGRLAARTRPERLVADLGRKPAFVLLARHAALRAQAASRARHVTALSAAAAEVQTPIVLLKTAAHEVLGLVPPGTRRAGDVDLLVPALEAAGFQSALLRRGWRERGLRAHAHQLAPLVEPEGGVVECHLSLPGVRLSGSPRECDFDALRAAGLLAPVADAGASLFVPAPAVLRAHIVAHGLWQHWLTPQSYPLGRLLADGLDLVLDDLRAAPHDPRTSVLVEAQVSQADQEALAALLARLRAGEPTLCADGEDSAARKLLDHVLAGAVDADYVRVLRREHTRRGLARPRAWPRLVFAALWPAPAQLDLLYGPAQGATRLWQRLRRPVDLVRRALD